MELTTDVVGKYVGGQLERKGQNGDVVHRGKIGAASVEGEGDDVVLKVWLIWVGTQDSQGHWVNDSDNLDYEAALPSFGVAEFEPGRGGVGTNLLLYSPTVEERLVFFPPDGSTLDPAEIAGLDLDRVRGRQVRLAALDLVIKDRALNDTKFTPPGGIGHNVNP